MSDHIWLREAGCVAARLIQFANRKFPARELLSRIHVHPSALEGTPTQCKLRKIDLTGELLDEHHSLDCPHPSFDRRFAALETFTQLGLLPQQYPWSRSDHPAYSSVDRARESLSSSVL